MKAAAVSCACRPATPHSGSSGAVSVATGSGATAGDIDIKAGGGANNGGGYHRIGRLREPATAVILMLFPGVLPRLKVEVFV